MQAIKLFTWVAVLILGLGTVFSYLDHMDNEAREMVR